MRVGVGVGVGVRVRMCRCRAELSVAHTLLPPPLPPHRAAALLLALQRALPLPADLLHGLREGLAVSGGGSAPAPAPALLGGPTGPGAVAALQPGAGGAGQLQRAEEVYGRAVAKMEEVGAMCVLPPSACVPLGACPSRAP